MDRWSSLTKELRCHCPTLEVREQEPMSRHTSFRIGGPARLMALPKNEAEAAEAIRTAAAWGIKPFFMGNGSNLLVADKGLEAFLIKAADGFGGLEEGDGGIIRAGAGVLLSRAACFARDRGLTGLEFAHGIPGSIGGAVTMNAGAYGGEMADIVEKVTFLRPDGKVDLLEGPELDFSYRHSAFEDGTRLLLRAVLRLKPGDPTAIRARMEDLSARRREKQPLEYPSAGSTFKRPADGYAAALIDRCGLKGYRVGGAQVSTKHAGFIINLGGATCDDVLHVIAYVYETVLAQTGIRLEPEVRLLGV